MQIFNELIKSNMFIKYCILATFLLLSFILNAEFVDKNTAEFVGRKFYYEHQSHKNRVDFASIKINSCITHRYQGITVFYEFDISPVGYIFVAADNASIPVLAYSFEEYHYTQKLSKNIEDWIDNYKIQMASIILNKLSPDIEISNEWKRLESSGFSFFNGKSMDPLLVSKWNQDSKYNASCPEDANGPGGRVYAGCVAVSMAQVMNYYKFPGQGIGSYDYYDMNYGLQSANFANTTYDWNSMVNSISSGQNPQIAQLLYHCGVSVDMMYSPSGSGAYTNDCVNSLVNYFNYKNTCSIYNKSSMSSSQWNTKLIQNLDAKMPLIYSGNPSSGAGHAFNCDGYQGTDYFHFNWGWSGNYDGYFYVNNLNPSSYNFNFTQKAIFNIYPNTPYPYYCTGVKTLHNHEGVFDDGSGPENYQNNQDCRWIIKPTTLIDHIQLNFDRFETESGIDSLIIYDGDNINCNVIASFSGASVPTQINSSGSSMLIRFITNGNNTNTGFLANYKSVLPIFCQGTKYLTDSSGVFSDGSDTNTYMNGILCKWYINSPNAQSIKLEFEKFNTESDKDLVKIYNPATTPSTLLAEFSGNNLPSSVLSPSGYMLVVFSTNADIVDSGWTAKYVINPNGINESEIIDIKLIPNPSMNGIFKLQFGEMSIENYKILISESNGKLIEELTSIKNEPIEIIDLSKYENGIYYINIIGERKSIVLKAFLIK